eukprot:g2241.t1
MENHDDSVWDLAVTKEYVYSAGYDGKISEWDVNNGNLTHTFNIKDGEIGHDKQIWSCAVDETNKLLLSVGNDLRMCGWDISHDAEKHGKLIGRIDDVHESSVYFVRMLSSQKSNTVICATGGQDGKLKLWTINTETMKPINEGDNSRATSCIQQAHDGGVLCMSKQTSSYGNVQMATGGSDTRIRIWDIAAASVRPLQVLGEIDGGDPYYDGDGNASVEKGSHSDGHTAAISNIQFSREGGSKLLLSGAWDGVAKYWDLRLRKPCVLSWEAHRQNISGMSFYGENFAITGSSDPDENMKVWDFRMFKVDTPTQYNVVPYLQVLPGHINTITCLNSLPDESQFFSGSSDRKVIQWYPIHDTKWDPQDGEGCCRIV